MYICLVKLKWSQNTIYIHQFILSVYITSISKHVCLHKHKGVQAFRSYSLWNATCIVYDVVFALTVYRCIEIPGNVFNQKLFCIAYHVQLYDIKSYFMPYRFICLNFRLILTIIVKIIVIIVIADNDIQYGTPTIVFNATHGV